MTSYDMARYVIKTYSVKNHNFDSLDIKLDMVGYEIKTYFIP